MIVLSMLVKNEANRYLNECLDSIVPFVDKVVVIDNGSTDNTMGIIHAKCLDKVCDLSSSTEFYEDEYDLRTLQFETTIKTIKKFNSNDEPTIIIVLDADEVLSPETQKIFPSILQEMLINKENGNDSVMFGIMYHFWLSKTHFRTDKLWSPCEKQFMFTYNNSYEYKFMKKKFACGVLPTNIYDDSPYIKVVNQKLKLMHFGYSDYNDTLKKHKIYNEYDPDGKYHNKKHLLSIDSKRIALEKFTDQ